MARKQLNKSEIRELLNSYNSELKKLQFQVTRISRTIEDLESRYESAPDPVLGITAAASVETTKETAPRRRKRGRPKKKTSAAKTTAAKKRGPGRPRKKSTTAKKTTAKKRGPGRPRKSSTTATKTTKKRGPGRPKKSTASKPKKRGRKPGTKIKSGYRLNEWDQFMINTLEETGHAMIHSDFQDKATDWAKKNNMKADEEEVKSRISRTIHKLANRKDRLKKTSYDGRGYAYGLSEWFNPNGSIKKKYQRK